MKITKAEWEKFWAALGPDWFMEDCDAPDDEHMQPSDVLSITCGELHWQGDNKDPKGLCLRNTHCLKKRRSASKIKLSVEV